MSAFIYSTELPNEIVNAYNRWALKNESKQVGRGSAWVEFCDCCERYGRKPLHVVELLAKQ